MPDPQAMQPNAVTVREYPDLAEAMVARSVLESAGMYAELGDEGQIRHYGLPTAGVFASVPLRVRAEDLAAATELLDRATEPA